MSENTLKATLMADMKAAMKSGDKARLEIVRLINSAIKQKEVDEKITPDDAMILAMIEKQVKQRRETILQLEAAGRSAEQEQAEIALLQHYLPAQLTADEIEALVKSAMDATGASSIKDMGKVMGILKPQIAGRADPQAVSAVIKARLG